MKWFMKLRKTECISELLRVCEDGKRVYDEFFKLRNYLHANLKDGAVRDETAKKVRGRKWESFGYEANQLRRECTKAELMDMYLRKVENIQSQINLNKELDKIFEVVYKESQTPECDSDCEDCFECEDDCEKCMGCDDCSPSEPDIDNLNRSLDS
jgi:hypothetical protein